MHVEDLEEFVALAKIRNFHQAADLLFMSQPTLTKHIRRLENELGVALFDRDSRTVELTQDGARICKKAQAVVDAYRDLKKDTPLSDGSGKLRIAVPFKYTHFTNLFSLVLKKARDRSIEFDLDIIDSGTADVSVDVVKDGCDVALANYFEEYSLGGFGCIELFRTEALIWLSSSDPLSQRDAVTAEDLSGMVYRPVAGPDNAWTRFVLSELKRCGVTPLVGKNVDIQYRIEPGEYGVVYGGRPSDAFGYGVVERPFEEKIIAAAGATYCGKRMTKTLAQFLTVLVDAAEEYRNVLAEEREL